MVEALGKTQAVAADLQGTNRLLQGFFIVLPDAHHFTDSPHLGAQSIFDAFEFLKSPAGEFHHHIIDLRGIFIKGFLPPVGELVQGEAGGK